MKYKEMSRNELASEIKRVKDLLSTNHNSYTYYQNRKYLLKLEKEWKIRYVK